VSDRIEKKFAEVKKQSRAALIPFIMGGDPDAAATAELLAALPGAGADIIEIGMPFSDPMADGPVIEAAGKRALAKGMDVAGILELVRGFRKKNEGTPIILMGYFNPVYRYGNEKFCTDAAGAGVDGLILVDLPPEEEQEMQPYLSATGLKLIRLIAPTSVETRLPLLAKSASGFIYYISVAGITGAKTATASDLKKNIDRLRQATNLPIAVGFGIKTPQQVREVAQVADAVVVGSALVDLIGKSGKDAVSAASRFVSELAKGLQR
jgi:tryptophan synthase alpha chain